MELTSEEKVLINKTFYQITPVSDRASERFYTRLFEIAPEVRPLFGKADMREQRKKLIDMIALVVYSLDKFEKVTKAIKSLGKRHIGYGVTNDQYETVGQALLWMLEQELGADWTPAVATAWTKVYTIMSDLATKDLETG
jgi:hemoglobin-like flavoprotein